jgi:hypothetical protein
MKVNGVKMLEREEVTKDIQTETYTKDSSTKVVKSLISVRKSKRKRNL